MMATSNNDNSQYPRQGWQKGYTKNKTQPMKVKWNKQREEKLKSYKHKTLSLLEEPATEIKALFMLFVKYKITSISLKKIR